MSDQPESLSAILAKMKKRVIGEDGIRYMLSADEVLSFLNSIEVAIKREHALLDANVNRVRELEAMLDGAANTVLDCAIKNKRSDTPGNAAAMRDALNRVGHLAKDLRNITERDTEVRADVNEIVDVCRAALAAPARNCDVGTAGDLHAAFVKHCDACDPPGGCCHRKDTRGMLDTNCASILKCFARFVLAKKEGGVK